MKVAIIGAGNGGVCIGAYMARKGATVNLYDKFDAVVAPIREKGGVDLKGVEGEGFAPFALATDNLSVAIHGCHLLMVVTPAFAHKELAEICGPLLTEGQIVVLNPGRTAGAIEFYSTARKRGGNHFIVAEAQSLVYACRRTGTTEGTIYKVKNTMPLATMPASDIEKALAVLRLFYPQFIAMKDTLETGLLNIGAIFHPGPTLLNIARVESKNRFRHYIDGITPCVGTLLDAIDAERCAVAAALDTPTLTTVQWLKSVYGEDIQDTVGIYEAVQKQSAYKEIMASNDPYVRYITEDVPMSLVPLSELGKIVGVSTPAMDAVITITSMIHKTDYRKNGRNLTALGLERMDKKALRAFVENG
jgi:opine dehydrogenase